MVNNPKGKNQWGEKNYPPDEELRKTLLEYSKLRYKVKEKLHHLKIDLGLEIRETKLREIENRLEIPTVRKPRLSQGTITQAATEQIAKDTNQRQGPDTIQTLLRNKGIMVSRDDITELMREIAPEGFDKRRPESKKKEVKRVGLISIGPFHEISGDGHEKLNAQALRMGNVSLPIYGYRDKWSGFILKLVVAPDTRKSAPMAFLFLDLIKEIGGIPLQVTTDAGPERAIQHAIQDCLRRWLAPQIDPDIFPTAVALPSVHNTVIEALWRFLKEMLGLNLKDAILEGLERNIFLGHYEFHAFLFYWIFVPLIQKELDNFRDYWNYHAIRPQKEKFMPSGHVPAVVIKAPEDYDSNARNCLIQVPTQVVNEIQQFLELDPEIGPRKRYFEWFTNDFDQLATSVHQRLGSPEIDFKNAWNVFDSMARPIRDYYLSTNTL